jgi:hypothetical protein
MGTKKTVIVAEVGDERGKASRLADIYERSAPAGFRLAYLLTGDRALAEDLVQEAFLRFVGRLHHLREPEAFDAYPRRTFVNLSKDTFRRRAVERSYLERHTAELREGCTDRDVAAYESMRTELLSLPQRQPAGADVVNDVLESPLEVVGGPRGVNVSSRDLQTGDGRTEKALCVCLGHVVRALRLSGEGLRSFYVAPICADLSLLPPADHAGSPPVRTGPNVPGSRRRRDT